MQLKPCLVLSNLFMSSSRVKELGKVLHLLSLEQDFCILLCRRKTATTSKEHRHVIIRAVADFT